MAAAFITLNSQPRSCLARLSPDGTLDMTFNPNQDERMDSLALQSDGKLFAVGDFPDMGGHTRVRIPRLNPDGTLETTFNPIADQSLEALALQPDRKLMSGGFFAMINAQTHKSAGGSVITWKRSGAGPELTQPPQLMFSLGAPRLVR